MRKSLALYLHCTGAIWVGRPYRFCMRGKHQALTRVTLCVEVSDLCDPEPEPTH